MIPDSKLLKYDNIKKLKEFYNNVNYVDKYISLGMGGLSINFSENELDFLFGKVDINPVGEMENCKYVDLKYLLPYYYLLKSDRSGMINGAEIRSPYLDDNLISYGLRYNPEEFTKYTKGKRNIYQLGEKYLPQQILRRKKKGFSTPLESWLNSVNLYDYSSLLKKYDLYDNIDIQHITIHQKYIVYALVKYLQGL